MRQPGGKRTEDRDLRAALADFKERNGLFITLGTWLLVAAGFGFRTPAQTTNELRTEIRENRISAQAKIDTLSAKVGAGIALNPSDLREMREDIRTLLVLRCLDRTLTDRERVISHLTLDRCNKL